MSKDLTRHKVGDLGQRYCLEGFGFPRTRWWDEVSFSDNLPSLIKAGDSLLQHPRCTAYRIVDRTLKKIVYSGGVMPDGSANVNENHGIDDTIAHPDETG